jgi:hypothetical protein
LRRRGRAPGHGRLAAPANGVEEIFQDDAVRGMVEGHRVGTAPAVLSASDRNSLAVHERRHAGARQRLPTPTSAQIICFTTGRGSAFGCAGVPAIKLATNNALFERMRDDMDVNCGDLLTGTVMPEAGSSHNPPICPSANRP